MRNFRLGLAALAVGGAVLLWWAFGARLALSPRRPANVLLISIDTLRADHVGAYGYAAARTPTLDALAQRGLRFANASTVTPLTLPAHTSLLTGTFPAFHGVRDNGQFYVDESQITLAEVLKEKGYRTGGFVGAFVLDRRWGIAQGFDTYFDDFDLSKYELAAGIDAAQRPANEVVDKSIAWINQSTGQPFFAWVHLYDPHAPYAAPPEFAARFPATAEGAYDAEIAFTDSQIGRLLDALGDRRDNTIVIAVGDHGEALGQHGEQQHGFFVYDAVTQVPLMIAGPRVPVAAQNDQVRIVDVMPTVLELLGIQVPRVVQGTSLVPLTRGKRPDLLALAETWYPRYHYGWSELTAVRDGRYKFISAPRRELYDLQTDPSEQNNLAEANPQRADALDRALRQMTAAVSQSSNAKVPQQVDPDVEERLRALGYVGSSVSPGVLDDRPRGDPKDKIGLYNALKLAGSDSVAGRIDDAIAKVRRVIEADPEVVEAYLILGNLHMKAKRTADAIAAYQKALSLDDRHENAAFALGLAYKQAGNLEAAEAGFSRVLQMNGRSTKAQWQLADLWMRRSDFARAEQALTSALTMNVDRPPFLLKLGECQIQLGKYGDAERNLRSALASKPDLAMAHYDLGLIYESRGDEARALEAYEAELTRNPAVYQAHFNLGKIYARAGRQKDAVEHFTAAVDVNPSFGAGYLYLAKALLDSGDLRASENAALKGLGANPERQVQPLGHYVLADIYTRMGRERDAARHVALGRRIEQGGT